MKDQAMKDEDCLERAMYAASESYSQTAYGFGDCGCAGDADVEDAPVFPRDSVVVVEAAI
jgi:hypothetical protein